MFQDEPKRQIDFKSMTLMMVNFFDDGFHVTNETTLLIVQVVRVLRP